MESSDINISTCEFETAIVSYLYDELSPTDRDGFESHLLECTPCTDEFAGMSYSRFSVFEWQREEFAPLPTPQISIPYPSNAVEGLRSLGYLSGLRALLTFTWQKGFAVAGIFAICIGIGFAVFNIRVQPAEEVSSIDKTRSEVNVAPTISPSLEPSRTASIVDITVADSPKNKSVKAGEAKYVVAEPRRAKVNRNQKLYVPQIGNDVAEQRIGSGSRMAPLLSTDAEEDDRSLRLADLFDDDTRL